MNYNIILKRIWIILISLIIIAPSYFIYHVRYIREGKLIEIRKHSIVIRTIENIDGGSIYQLETKSRIYNTQGKEIFLSDLHPGDHVKIKLFPRVFGGLFSVRGRKTIKWVQVLKKD
jgi:hypothetical protein